MFIPSLRVTFSQLWRVRRTAGALARLDAHTLRDIGLDRSQILSVSTTLAARFKR